MCLYTLITILGTIKIIKDTWVSKQAIYSTETVYMYIHILYIHILSSVLITDREAQMWNLSFLKMIWVCIYICKYTYVHINSELEIDIKIWAFLYFKLHWHISQEKNMMTLKSVSHKQNIQENLPHCWQASKGERDSEENSSSSHFSWLITIP